jgi:translation initiation factor IF-2
VRLFRGEAMIFEGKISSLRRFKDDVQEVRGGFEFGIALEGHTDYVEGDILEIYRLEKVEEDH